jgi:hydrogenase maturation protease
MGNHDVKIAVIGIGNLLVSDDGVGIRVVRSLQENLHDERVQCKECERGGLDLLELLKDSDIAVIVDAAKTEKTSPGSIATFTMRQPFVPGSLPSLHTIGLNTVLAFGEVTGMQMPIEVIVYAIEAAETETMSERCTTEIESAIPHAVEMLMCDLLGLLPDLQVAARRGVRIPVYR